jgi:hypothetical protein
MELMRIQIFLFVFVCALRQTFPTHAQLTKKMKNKESTPHHTPPARCSPCLRVSSAPALSKTHLRELRVKTAFQLQFTKSQRASPKLA